MSVCLQSIVDELLNQKEGNEFSNVQVPQSQNPVLSYIRRDGKLYQQNRGVTISSSSDTLSSLVNYSRVQDAAYIYIYYMYLLHVHFATNAFSLFFPQPENDVSLHINCDSIAMRKKLKEKISTTVFFQNGRESVQNEAFEEIGDDDL